MSIEETIKKDTFEEADIEEGNDDEIEEEPVKRKVVGGGKPLKGKKKKTNRNFTPRQSRMEKRPITFFSTAF